MHHCNKNKEQIEIVDLFKKIKIFCYTDSEIMNELMSFLFVKGSILRDKQNDNQYDVIVNLPKFLVKAFLTGQ